MRLKTASDYKTSRWDGGTTTELLIWPPDGSYQKRDFQVRISSAVVEKEESDFTILPGVHRFLMMQQESVRLQFDDGKTKTLAPLEVFSFDGGIPVHCFGGGTDLNLMLKGGTRGRLSCRTLAPSEKVTLTPADGLQSAVYLISGLLTADSAGSSSAITPGSLLTAEPQETVRLQNTGSLEAVFGIFEFECALYAPVEARSVTYA